jgi:PKD repeat protein
MGRRVIATALAVLGAGCALAGSATAATRTVDPATGPYTTITDALHAAGPGDTIDIHQGHYDEQLWVDKDDITLHGAPGTIVSSTAPFTVSLMGARDRVEGLWIAGGPGGLRIEGAGASVFDATITADDPAIALKGDVGRTSITHTTIRALALAGTAILARNLIAAPSSLDLRLTTAIVVGGRQGTALDVETGQTGDTSVVGSAEAHLVASTVAGAPTAVRAARAGLGGLVTIKAYNSIVHGAGAVDGAGNERDAADAATFVNAPALDFHLRADSPAIGISTLQPASEVLPGVDWDGVPRPLFGTAAGAFEFINKYPIARLSASTAAVRQGVPVAFDASGSADPDVGGRITTYVWRFGDGTPDVTTTTPTIQHAYVRVGTRSALVRVSDNNGVEIWSAPVAVTVTDAIAPALAITSPRENARLHRYRTVAKTKTKHKGRKATKKKRVVNVLRFGGRVSDEGGVARVEVVLRRTAPKTPKGLCTYLDAPRLKAAARPCADPPVVRATVTGGAWSWSTPSRLAVPAGRWELTVRATDPAGNLTTSVLDFTVS